jgi:chorismate dehydratase
MKECLRIGAVPYLNTRPLIAGLEKGAIAGTNGRLGKIELRLAVPSRLPELLRQGEVDVALIPSIEYLRGRPFFIIPGISIASRGAVESVLLFLKVPRIKDIRRVALDESSLTSATLTKIILQERYGLGQSGVEYVLWQGGGDLNIVQADAVLVIGDNAMKMHRQPGNGGKVLDLGAEWKALTRLPFVYALWVTSRKDLIEGATRLLLKARERGLAALKEIATAKAMRLGLKPEFCLRYLSENIHYGLGEEEMAGLRRFYHYALSMGLASEGVNLDSGSKTRTREVAFQRADRA